jgi:S1-C subfamily serine protease
VRNTDDLLYAFEDAGVGKSVTLTVERDGRRRNVEVELIPIR